MKGTWVYKTTLVIMAFFIINLVACGFTSVNSAQSADLLSSYNILKNQYPDYISRMAIGGASEGEIQSFLIDLDSNVRARGQLDEANFNNVMFEALQEVIQYRKHRTVFRAMLSEFEEEIDYTLENNMLHPNLIPLRNAVKDSVLGLSGQNQQPDKPGSIGGGGGVADPIIQSIRGQIESAEATITLSSNSNAFSVDGNTIQEIKSSKKNLEVTLNSVKFMIPPEALNIARNLTLTISATPLDSSATALSLRNQAAGQQVLGAVYELNCGTDAGVNGLILQQAVAVTLSYAAANTTAINAGQLDVYYYNETTETWTPMHGTVDKANKTITFTTTHFSKYAIMTKAGEKPEIKETTPTTATGAEKFADLTGHWAAAEIDSAVKLGIASGMSPTEFAPDQNITRAQFATLLARAIGLKNSAGVQSHFNDVLVGTWYYDAVNSAAEAGLVSGYSANIFGPNDLITREQMTVMINNALAYKNKDGNNNASALEKFRDRNEVSSWAIPGVSTAVQKGIITGRSADTIAPRQNATRAEGTAMILRMYKLL